MFAWQVYENDQWNIIGALIGGSITPLVTMRLDNYEALRPFAELHHMTTGLPVRGARYGQPESFEVLNAVVVQ